jgi:hypothetical protein
MLKVPSSVALLFISGISAASIYSSFAAVDYDVPPDPKLESGLVRVWNAKWDPLLDRDHVPEAQLGDAIVLEVRNIDRWFSENLQKGAWRDEAEVASAPPVVHRLIGNQKLVFAVEEGKTLEMATKADDSDHGNDVGPVADRKRLANQPLMREELHELLPFKSEQGVDLDPSKESDAIILIEACENAVQFVKELRDRKAQDFVLTINDVRLPGLALEPREDKEGWRKFEQFLNIDYAWWQIRLQGPRGSEFEKGWARLMAAAGPRFSLVCKVSLSLPREIIPLPTNVTTNAEDSRCRFNLLATTKPTPTPGQKKLAKDEAVYLLAERDTGNHVIKGEIVAIDNAAGDAPYVVHRLEKGGTQNYRADDLARLPPDPIPRGVIRVWNPKNAVVDWQEGQKLEVPEAKLEDRLVVEVRNFEAWLASQIDNGFLQDDSLILKASLASPKLDEFIKQRRFSTAAKIGEAIHRIIESSRQQRETQVVDELEEQKLRDRDIAALHFPDLESEETPDISPLPKTRPSTPQEKAEIEEAKQKQEEAEKKQDQIAQNFLAPYQAAHSLLQELAKTRIRTLVLTINDIALDITPDYADYTPVGESERPPGDLAHDTYHWLTFSLKPRTDQSSKEQEKVADPFKRLFTHPDFTMPSKVALALKSGSETLTLPTAVTQDAKDPRCRFALIGIEPWKFWPMAFIFVVILGTLLFFAARTDILRDPCRRRPEGVEPVSLARTQMAFWFVVIAAAFSFLWVTTGNIDTINGTCLTLLAIGTSTALASVAIQRNRGGCQDLSDVLQKSPHEMLQMTPIDVLAAIQTKRKEVEEAAANASRPEDQAEALALLKRQEEEIDRFLKRRPNWIPPRIYYWRYRLRTVLEDLLTEQAGIYDFQRFQILAWTVVLGFAFVAKVLGERAMPQFDPNLLLLMGISSGAYIGFKAVSPRKAGDEPPKEDDKDSSPKPA